MKIFLKRYWLWVTATALFVLMLFVFADTDIFEYLAIRRNIRRLNAETERWQAQSSADSLFVVRMGNDDFIERYAREQFYMHAEGEEVYIVEQD